MAKFAKWYFQPSVMYGTCGWGVILLNIYEVYARTYEELLNSARPVRAALLQVLDSVLCHKVGPKLTTVIIKAILLLSIVFSITQVILFVWSIIWHLIGLRTILPLIRLEEYSTSHLYEGLPHLSAV